MPRTQAIVTHPPIDGQPLGLQVGTTVYGLCFTVGRGGLGVSPGGRQAGESTGTHRTPNDGGSFRINTQVSLALLRS